MSKALRDSNNLSAANPHGMIVLCGPSEAQHDHLLHRSGSEKPIAEWSSTIQNLQQTIEELRSEHEKGKLEREREKRQREEGKEWYRKELARQGSINDDLYHKLKKEEADRKDDVEALWQALKFRMTTK